MSILLTGTSGNIGYEAALHIQKTQPNLHFKVLVRHVHNRFDSHPNITQVIADYEDKQSLDKALVGVERVLLVSRMNREDSDKLEINFIDACVAAGVKLIVKISVHQQSLDGVGSDKVGFIARHKKIEAHLKSVTKNYTLVRPNFADQNLFFLLAPTIPYGFWSSPMPPEATIPWSDGRDSGVLAAVVLMDPDVTKHIGRSYHVSCQEFLTVNQVTNTVNEVMKLKLGYKQVSQEEYVKTLVGVGVSQYFSECIANLLTLCSVPWDGQNHPLLTRLDDFKKLLELSLVLFASFVRKPFWDTPKID